MLILTSQNRLELIQHSEISDCTLYENSEIYTDAWGKEFNWQYDTHDGWNEKRRQAVIFENERNMLQSKRIPAYTIIGYAVMKISSQLYELKHEAKAESKIFLHQMWVFLNQTANLSISITSDSDLTLVWVE